MSWAVARTLRDSLRDSRSCVACDLILPVLGGTVARAERRGPDVEKILAGGGVTSNATLRRWIAACMSKSFCDEYRGMWRKVGGLVEIASIQGLRLGFRSKAHNA